MHGPPVSSDSLPISVGTRYRVVSINIDVDEVDLFVPTHYTDGKPTISHGEGGS